MPWQLRFVSKKRKFISYDDACIYLYTSVHFVDESCWQDKMYTRTYTYPTKHFPILKHQNQEIG